MTIPIKIAICAAVYLIAGLIAVQGLYPALLESQGHAEKITQDKAQLSTLENQLAANMRARQDPALLTAQLNQLRERVPQSAETDILVMDLETMCKASGLKLIAVEEPGESVMKKVSEEELARATEDTKLSLGSKSLPQKPAVKGPAKPAPKTELQQAADETGLKSVVKTVYVAGDYPGLVDLMRAMEKYQRVVGINQVAIVVPTKNGTKDEAAQRAEKLKLKEPLMSFVMTVYYLP